MPRSWLRLLLACLLFAAPGPYPAAPLAGALSAIVLGWSADAWAGQSGGYSRPGGSGGYAAPTRRPSLGGGSGGYSRPPAGGYGAPSGGGFGAPSGGDRAVSRQSSGEALRQYRAPPPPPPPSGGGGYDYGSRRPSTANWGGYASAPQYRGWYPPPPPPAYGWAQPGRSFGVWDGLLLWGLLNSLSAPGHAQFFYNNQDDPGYRAWRADAQRASQQDPALRAKLADLDAKVAELQGQPKTPGALPPDVAAALARSGGGGWVWIIIFLGVGLLVLLWWLRRRAAQAVGSVGAAPVPAALRGSTATRFRVGMTFPVDPTPFILAASATKVKPIQGGGMISVEAIGVQMDGAAALNRLYLPGRDAFFLLHLEAGGHPDECRYFSKLDEVAPASNEEWGQWLDPAQGMIGWPQFQTKDGLLYDRVWNPGPSRIAPREMTETIEDLKGTTTRKLTVMLYGRSTGAAAPAPPTEYVMVAAVEDGQQGYVEIHVGIDVNPASLTLPSVPIS